MKNLVKMFGLVLIVINLFTTCGCEKHKKDELYLCVNKNGNLCGNVENASKFSSVVAVKLLWHEESVLVGAGSNVKKEYVLLAHGDRKNNSIAVMLPETLNSNYLHSLNLEGRKIYIETPSTMTVSNPNVKVFTFNNYCGVDKDGNVIAYFRPSAIDEDGNVKDVFLTYVDSDVTISGYIVSLATVIPTEDYTGPGELKITATFSIEWKKGWNVWWMSNSSPTPEGNVTRTYSTSPISDMKWLGEENQLYFNIN